MANKGAGIPIRGPTPIRIHHLLAVRRSCEGQNTRSRKRESDGKIHPGGLLTGRTAGEGGGEEWEPQILEIE